MSRNYLILLIIAGFVGLLLGCHAGGNSPMAPDNSATVVLPETRTVNENGRFDDITFPSGAVIKCPNDKTFQEGVKVTATEEKVPVITDNSGKFSYIYVYNISAVLPSENSLTADVPVNTIEKPLSVTLPNDSTAGTCYIGTRASEKDPWRYSLATDGINSNARFIRLSANTSKTCTFNLYRLNIQFRLFVFDNEEKKDEVQVDTIAMVPAEDVEIKDGKYTGKLTVKLNVEGDNLNGLKAEDLIAKITYRSENQQGANIDFTTNKNDLTDKAVTGSYEHSFEVSNIKVENTLGNTAELSFELNLDGVSLEDFPKDFLVEFYSKGSDENTRPFEYTQTFSFETKEDQINPEPQPEPEPEPQPQPTPTPTPQPEPQPEPELYALAVNSGTGIASVEGAGDYKAGESVTVKCSIKDGYEFDSWSGEKTGKTNELTFNMPESDVTITANAKVITYNIAFNLDDGQTTEDNPVSYDVTSATITLKNPTKTGYTFVGWSGTGLTGKNNTNVTISKGSTGDKKFTANYSIVNYALTYTNVENCTFATANPTTYNVETETFTLTNPTKDDYLFLGWTYEGQTTPQLEVTITKGSTTGAKTYTANWKLNLTLAIAQDDGAIIDGNNNPPLYYTKATFTMTPNFAAGTVMTDTEKSNILSAIIVKDSAGTKFENATATWNNESKIALSFLKDLTASTTFTISFGEIDGVALTYSPFNFKTFYYKGKGTAQVPYQVENAAQLDMVRKYPSYHFKQTADIDLFGITNWVAICNEVNNSWNPTNPFTGVYDGDSKKIKNFTIHSSESIEYAGLFGFVNAGTIKNLTVDGFSIRGASADTPLNVHYIGIIAAQIENGSSITDCHITDSRVTNATDSASIASLTPYAGNDLYAGGICSINNGTISNCSIEKCQIKCSVDNAGGVYLGGICYLNSGSISNCDIDELIIACSVTELQSNEFLGGICADTYSSSVITNCSVKNTSITGSKGNSLDLFLGGICSLNIGRIEICDVQNTTVKGTGNDEVYVGGISGNNGGNSSDSITNCYLKDSTVESQGRGCIVGGIAAKATSITSCYIENTTVKSNGGSCYIGGISGTSAAISKCYVTGSEITESSGNTGGNIGGISGYNTKNITSSYLINTNVKGSGDSGDYVGGICGYLRSRGSISNCYVYEDNNHSISKIDSNGEGKLGYLVGLLYKYDSNPSSNAKVTDSFCNMTTSNLSDLVNSVGSESSSSAPPNDYGYITNCYGGVTSENFSSKTWSDGAWSDYDAVSASSWPPDLSENRRPTQP